MRIQYQYAETPAADASLNWEAEVEAVAVALPDHSWSEVDAVMALEAAEDALVALADMQARARALKRRKGLTALRESLAEREIIWTSYIMSLPSFSTVVALRKVLKAKHARAVQIVAARAMRANADSRRQEAREEQDAEEAVRLAAMVESAKAWLAVYRPSR